MAHPSCASVAQTGVPKTQDSQRDTRSFVYSTLPARQGSSAQAFRLPSLGLVRGMGYLGAYLRRQRGRLGTPKLITATAHKLARIVYNLMRFGEAYRKKEEQAYADEVRQRQERQLARRAAEMGYELMKIEETPVGQAT